MTHPEFIKKHMEPIGDLRGHYLSLRPILSNLDGKFSAYQLRMIAYAMDRMRDDPEMPEDFYPGWDRDYE
ncbi:MAG: hypothetical protein ACYSW8_11125 [Planctomycetota bacterium]